MAIQKGEVGRPCGLGVVALGWSWPKPRGGMGRQGGREEASDGLGLRVERERGKGGSKPAAWLQPKRRSRLALVG